MFKFIVTPFSYVKALDLKTKKNRSGPDNSLSTERRHFETSILSLTFIGGIIIG
jgi:hypothetical protein